MADVPVPSHDAPPTSSKLVTFRNAFISGVFLLAPLIVTVWAFGKIVDIIGGSFWPIYQEYLPDSLQKLSFVWHLLTTIVVLLLVTAFGFLSNYVFGKFFFSITERAILRIPGVGTVYQSIKQIVATFGSQNRNVFSKVVMVEFPRKGVWAIGFLTNKAQGEAQSAIGPEIWTVFMPTTPNPTSGFLLLLPKQDIIELDMTVGDGMKMIISGGAVLPPTVPAADAQVVQRT